MDIRAAEISRVIRDQIANFDADAQVSEVGTVLSVGDGIARIRAVHQRARNELREVARIHKCLSQQPKAAAHCIDLPFVARQTEQSGCVASR